MKFWVQCWSLVSNWMWYSNFGRRGLGSGDIGGVGGRPSVEKGVGVHDGVGESSVVAAVVIGLLLSSLHFLVVVVVEVFRGLSINLRSECPISQLTDQLTDQSSV